MGTSSLDMFNALMHVSVRHRSCSLFNPRLICALQAAKQTAENIAHAKLAVRDVASSRDAREAGAKVWTLWRNAEGGAFVLAVARILVSASDIQNLKRALIHA